MPFIEARIIAYLATALVTTGLVMLFGPWAMVGSGLFVLLVLCFADIRRE